MADIMTDGELNSFSDLIVEEADARCSEVDVVRFKLERAANRGLICGKTVDQWNEEFTIRISPNAMPADIIRYSSDWVGMNDLAYRTRSKLNQQLKTYLMSYSQKLSGEVGKHALNKSRKVMPAADTLREVAQSQMGIRYDILIQYEKEIDFFSEMIYKLKDTLKAINTIGMSNGTLLKGELGHM